MAPSWYLVEHPEVLAKNALLALRKQIDSVLLEDFPSESPKEWAHLVLALKNALDRRLERCSAIGI